MFARQGYAAASAESIAREAGMSKATFYEHFANKEECMAGLFDDAAAEVMAAIQRAVGGAEGDPVQRLRAGIGAFLETLAERPETYRAFLVEVVGAGPAVAARRDAILAAFADVLYRESVAAARRGRAEPLGSPHEAYGLIGAVAELASRHLRRGIPTDAAQLGPVIEGMMLGLTGHPRESS